MNLIPVIREALGLEVNEEFQLLKSGGTLYNNLKYRFANNDTFQWFDSGTGCWNSNSLITLEKIVYGKVFIRKLPFKPKESELYYFISLNSGEVANTYYYSDISYRKLNVKSGNCYRTYKEAKKHVDEWMSKVYGENWKELLK